MSSFLQRAASVSAKSTIEALISAIDNLPYRLLERKKHKCSSPKRSESESRVCIMHLGLYFTETYYISLRCIYGIAYHNTVDLCQTIITHLTGLLRVTSSAGKSEWISKFTLREFSVKHALEQKLIKMANHGTLATLQTLYPHDRVL